MRCDAPMRNHRARGKGSQFEIGAAVYAHEGVFVGADSWDLLCGQIGSRGSRDCQAGIQRTPIRA